MFQVKEKKTGKIFTVYSTERAREWTMFLMYYAGFWQWQNANNFEPVN